MRVTHVIFNMRTGGTETMLIDIMEQQAIQGAEVSLVIINDDNEPQLLQTVPVNIKVVCIGRPTGSKNPWYILMYNRALRRLRPDVIHIHTVKAAGMIIGHPAPLGLTVHCCEAPLSYLDRYSRVWAISHAVETDIQSRYALPSTIVYNGVATQRITQRIAPPAMPSTFKLIQVGRLVSQIKGQDMLIDAVAALVKNRGLDIDLTIVGEGPSREQLVQQATQSQIQGRVHFLGNKSRQWIYSHLADYDILVQPSRIEGFGLTLVEGMAAGIPVIASTTPGLLEVLDDGQRGTTFTTGSTEALTQALLNAITHYDRLQAQAADDARWAKRTYDIATTARNYLNQYSQMI